MKFYVHANPTDPGANHEVHAEGCWWLPKPENRHDLGECADEFEALDNARELFADADGCRHCCPEIDHDLPEMTYYVNDNATKPGDNHEVHREDCAWKPEAGSRTELGRFRSVKGAVRAARKLYADADGCAHCCTEKNEDAADRGRID